MDPILCYNCGHPLGDVKDAFDLMRQIKTLEYAQEKNIDVTKMPIVADTKLDLSSLFKQLNINKWCCRLHLTTTINFNEMLSS